MKFFLSLVALLPVILTAKVYGTTSIILKPVKEGSGQEIALVVIPGAYIKGDEYETLAKYIQDSSPHKLWVALTTGYRRDFPSPTEVPAAIEDALSTLQQEGMANDALIFMAGHSAGGTEVQKWVYNNPESVTGMMLWASYLSFPEQSLQNYPVPLALISGDLDGLTRITKISTNFEELRAIEKSQRPYTPLVVIEGANHGQFATGEMPENVLDNDLTPELSLDQALKRFAEISGNFMGSLVGSSGALYTEARDYMMKEWERTEKLLDPLMDAHAMEELDGQSPWTAVAQKLIAGLASDFTDVHDLVVSKSRDFESSKPTLVFDGTSGRMAISTYSHLIQGGSLVDVSQWYFSAEEIASKMKRRSAIDKKIDTGYRRDIPCSDFNQESIGWAFSASSNSTAFQRYLAKGKRMVPGADIMAASVDQWESSSLVYNTTATGELQVTSTIWLSDAIGLPANAEMHYCRLLSPFKVLEWMYVDSLR